MFLALNLWEVDCRWAGGPGNNTGFFLLDYWFSEKFDINQKVIK
jgi:hypothetical protein